MVYSTKVNPQSSHETLSTEYCHGVVKPKENIFHHKCKKSLKNKLKKYKLRRDGQEDPDILDVSNTFHTSLLIHSPTKKPYFNNNINECEEFCRPLNYISKMVRKKGNILSEANRDNIVSVSNSQNVECDKAIESNPTKQNAFHVMMQARNKSLGSNSPGKNNHSEELTEEILEKRDAKLKRKLLLQKFADSKGATKKKDLDKQQEEYVKQKMDERAERLRELVTKSKNIKKTKVKKTKLIAKPIVSGKLDCSDIEEHSINDAVKKPVLSEKLTMDVKKQEIKEIDIFRKLNDEDAEFLKKLSPSMKKKHSMLSYFNKVEKESEFICVDEDIMDTDESTQNLLKVKLPKSKKKSKRKKLSLKKSTVQNNSEEKVCEPVTSPLETMEKSEVIDVDSIDLELIKHTSNLNNVEPDENKPRKRKRKQLQDLAESTKPTTDKNAVDEPINITSEGRPKRHVKKPIKYVDDLQLSSDDDCHILTPKKKKHSDDKVIDAFSLCKGSKETNKSKSKKDDKCKKVKPSKLAPIFGGKLALDAAALEAKQRFLHSGMPEKMKKIIAHEKALQETSADFIPVTHVQQIDNVAEVPLGMCNLKFKMDSLDSDVIINENISYKQLLNLGVSEQKITQSLNAKIDINIVLKSMKETYPEFPIFRTYRRLLHKSKGEHKDIIHFNVDDSAFSITDISHRNECPNSLNWTEKYRATSTKQIMGNFEAVKEVKKWLVSWTESQFVQKTKNGSDSDFWNSDGDSRDSMRTSKNLLIIHGPVGSGKTSCVYAVAAELAVKVIEVNASSRRTGKILLQELQEATQSHKVNRGKGSSAENSQNSQEITNRKGRGKKSLMKLKLGQGSQQMSQEDGRTGMSLILIDDADVAFDQDDGFIAAIAQLVHSSKRPLILVTSSLTCPHLQRFVHCENIIRMSPLSPKILGTWLDLLCLVDSRICWPGFGNQVLDYFNGDIRKTMNFVQFLAISEAKRCYSEDEDATSKEIGEIDDENSSQSWAGDGAITNAPQVRQLDINRFKGYVGRELGYPLDTVSVWWSIPTIVKSTPDKTATELDNISRLLDDISLADCLCSDSTRLAHVTLSPWRSFVGDSVSERENMDYTCRAADVSEEISYELVKRSLDTLGSQRSNVARISFPGLLENRKLSKLVSRHESLAQSLHPLAPGRRAAALDYWPLCRAICRAERGRGDTNCRRNNRFYHYLKTPKMNSDVLEKLCDSLC